MKKLTTLLLLILMTSLSNAQTTKPTIEETVQYIKNELQDRKNIWAAGSQGPFEGEKYPTIFENFVINRDIKMESCRMSFTKASTNSKYINGVKIKDETSVENISIDFSQVVSISTWNVNNNGHEFTFTIKNTDGSESKVEWYVGYIGSINENAKSSKPYKAFQHLRKLCGAPEPISFD